MKRRQELRVEICANSAESCVEAARGGAYRVELCAGIPEGGTTPSVGEVCAAIEATQGTGLVINAIIRPRGGDFLYSELEMRAMMVDIETIAGVGVDGLVWGCLTKSGEVDMHKNAELMRVAKARNPKISTTFHRAFDMCRDPYQALEDIIALGFDRVLTSGLQPSAVQGVELLRELVERADDRIVIMPGCGVNEENIGELAVRTGAVEFHFSGRHKVQSQMEFQSEVAKMGDPNSDEFSRDVTSAVRVQNTIENLKKHIQ